MFKIDNELKNANTPRTIRFTEPLFEKLNETAAENNISFNGATTLLYSKLVEGFFKENYIPYIKVSAVVKNKIVAKEGE